MAHLQCEQIESRSSATPETYANELEKEFMERVKDVDISYLLNVKQTDDSLRTYVLSTLLDSQLSTRQRTRMSHSIQEATDRLGIIMANLSLLSATPRPKVL